MSKIHRDILPNLHVTEKAKLDELLTFDELFTCAKSERDISVAT